MQHVDRIDADFIDHVAALHHEQGRAAHTGYQLADADEVFAFQQEVADGVVLERVDAE